MMSAAARKEILLPNSLLLFLRHNVRGLGLPPPRQRVRPVEGQHRKQHADNAGYADPATSDVISGPETAEAARHCASWRNPLIIISLPERRPR
jgi:hypothetical protein